MSKGNKVIITGEGNACPKCRAPMERRKHRGEPKTRVFYTEWDYCKPCGHVQHYQEFRKEKIIQSLKNPAK